MKNITDYGLADCFVAQAMLTPQYKLARVISQHKGTYKVATEQGEIIAEISGKFRYSVKRQTDYPAVGDFVMVNSDNGRAVIQLVLTRTSVVQRTAVGASQQAQVIAANIDIIFICMSFNNNFNLSRLERYLSIAWDSGATPVVLLTKVDLCDNIDEVLSDLRQITLGADVIVTSVFDPITIQKLNSYLKRGITASFIGSSGVGKSTLINKLAGQQLIATKETGKEDRGRHTTTTREMFVMPTGAVVIDTPGMRELGVESADLSQSFADIEDLITRCKYRNCSHTNEPGCAVRDAIQKGDLDDRRLQNYIKIKREAKYEGLSAKEIETEKLNTMFHGFGGMKKIKDYKNAKKQGY